MPNLEQLKLIEASLFIAGRPIKINDLLNLIEGKEEEDLNEIIDQLSKNLEERKSFLEIVKIENEYMMRIKPAIKKELGDIQTRKSLSDEFVQLLAIIAIKQPIKLGDVRKIYSGKNIKEDILELERKGFIQIKKEKKTKFLVTTPHFTNVFNLNPEDMKGEILRILTKRLSKRVVAPPKVVLKDLKRKKETLTEYEMKEIEERYYELIERLEKEREEERLRLEEEAKRKAEEVALLENLFLDPMASLFKQKKEEKKEKIENNERNTEIKKDNNQKR